MVESKERIVIYVSLQYSYIYAKSGSFYAIDDTYITINLYEALPMGVYSKEIFGGVPTPVVGDQGASTACGNYDASHSLSCAVIETIIEGYIAFSATNNSISSLDQAKQFASNITKPLVDNGDITGEHLAHIQEWIGRHYQLFSGRTSGMPCEKKLLGKILEKCDAAQCAEIAEVQKLKAQLCAAKEKALAKYGPAICKEVMTFVQRYGRSFDQSYIKEWTDMCCGTTTVPEINATDPSLMR